VKLGYGGIRRSSCDPGASAYLFRQGRSLREKNALKALHILSQKAHHYQEHDVFPGYVFCGRWSTGSRSSMIFRPDASGDERVCAPLRGAWGISDPAASRSVARDYADHTKKVRASTMTCSRLPGGRALNHTQDYSALLDPETPEQEAASLLKKLGFRDPGKAYRDLLLLREGTAFVHQTPRSRKLFNESFPRCSGDHRFTRS